VSSLTLAAIVHVSLLAGGESTYAQAHKITSETGKPMVVLVSAKWCPACQTMKDNVMPQVTRKGILGRVSYTVVDLDKERKLGSQLTKGGPIPQLIMYRKGRDGWLRRRLIGGQSVTSVSKFIDQGIKLDEEEKKTSESGEQPDEDKRAAVDQSSSSTITRS